MTSAYSIQGSDGLNLHVREWGDPEGTPILFIHGWSANHMAWKYQYKSALTEKFRLVALDLRGHGMSDAPLKVEYYSDDKLWADDIAAIIDGLDLEQPVLVGWSYGGYVICDYLSVYGQSAISGINFVGGGVQFNEEAFGTLLGPGFLNYIEGATKPDLPTNINAVRQFVRELVAGTMKQEDFEITLAFNMIVPTEVRSGLLARNINADDLLEKMTTPVLVTQGREDRHVLPAMSERILEMCPTAKASWYDEVAHMPFLENTQRYNTELSEFAQAVQT